VTEDELRMRCSSPGRVGGAALILTPIGAFGTPRRRTRPSGADQL
jgi:hypothetical protein